MFFENKIFNHQIHSCFGVISTSHISNAPRRAMNRNTESLILFLSVNFHSSSEKTLACKCRAATDKAMKISRYNDTSVQPQFTQWGQPGEIHGEVRCLWSYLANSRLMIPYEITPRGVEDKYGYFT